ncbi:hypothetical protein V2J09_021270 [Rumex salicifolius]
MERNSRLAVIDQTRDYEQIQYNSIAPRNTVIGSQIPGGMKPVLNYSIQTGEEFALEFMRERAHSWQHFSPSSSSDPGIVVGLGTSHARSESDLDISAASSTEKSHVQEEQKHLIVDEERGVYTSTQSLPVISSKTDIYDRVLRFASFEASDSPPMVKFLCSYGGKILPRPSDGKLRYVGGETHIIKISHKISWMELVQRACLIYKETNTIKYQLPGEDLDALVSVSSDEDLQNMIEECKSVEDAKSNKPRMFLFSVHDMDYAQFGLVDMDANAEVHYLIAINGLNCALQIKSIESKSSSMNYLDELFSLKVDKGSDKIALESASERNDKELVSGKARYQPVLLSSSSSHEFSSLHIQPSIMHEQLNGMSSAEKFIHPHKKDKNVSPVPLQTSHIYSPNYTLHGDELIFSGLLKPTDQHHTSQKPLSRDSDFHNLEASVKAATLKRDQFLHGINEAEQMQSVGREASRKMTRDNSISRISEGESESYHVPVGSGIPLVCTGSNGMSQETFPVSGSSGVVTEGRRQTSLEQDESQALSRTVPPPMYHALSDQADFGLLEPPVLPQRVFHSVCIPREQTESSRLSKSDDSFGTKFLMAHLLPDLAHSIAEVDENSKDEHLVSSAEALPLKPQNVDDGMLPFDLISDKNNDFEGQSSNFQKARSQDLMPNSSCEMENDKDKDGQRTNAQNKVNEGTRNLPIDIRQDTSSAEVEASGQGDIIIDIGDRFPRDFLADIFSMASISQGFTEFSPLGSDGAGLSLNVGNRVPTHWSFFCNLAQDDYVTTAQPLIENTHLGLSDVQENNEEQVSIDYRLPLLKSENVPPHDSGLTIDTVNHNATSCIPTSSNLNLQSDCQTSRTDGNESHIVGIVSKHIAETSYQDKTVTSGQHNPGASIDVTHRLSSINSLQIIRNEDLEELKELGSGTYGTVYHGKWRGTDVAIKRLKKSCFMGHSPEQQRLTVDFWREAEILSKLHHPNVVAFYGVVQDGPEGTLATVTEYMANGSLRHVLLSKERQLDRRKRLTIAMGAAFGMEYLHSKNIVGDFGLSKIKRNTLVTGGVRGTLPWMAPELLNGSSSKVSEKVDVFSFGIVLWEILTGEEPYSNMHYGAIIGGIVNNTLRPSIPSFCDAEWRLLMEQCWSPDPSARPCFTEIARRLRAMAASAAHSKPPQLK